LLRAAELQPGAAQAHALLAKALADGFEPERASAEFREAATLAPQSAEMHFFCGRALLDLGQKKAAREELHIALRLSPGQQGVSRLLARIDSADPAGVKPAFGSLSEQLANLKTQAENAEEIRDWKTAEAASRAAATACGACPNAAAFHRDLGLLLGRSGDLPAAFDDLKVALKLKPDDETVASALKLLGRHERKQ
jgi:Flp pilus assembly protein TadD